MDKNPELRTVQLSDYWRTRALRERDRFLKFVEGIIPHVEGADLDEMVAWLHEELQDNQKLLGLVKQEIERRK